MKSPSNSRPGSPNDPKWPSSFSRGFDKTNWSSPFTQNLEDSNWPLTFTPSGKNSEQCPCSTGFCRCFVCSKRKNPNSSSKELEELSTLSAKVRCMCNCCITRCRRHCEDENINDGSAYDPQEIIRDTIKMHSRESRHSRFTTRSPRHQLSPERQTERCDCFCCVETCYCKACSTSPSEFGYPFTPHHSFCDCECCAIDLCNCRRAQASQRKSLRNHEFKINPDNTDKVPRIAGKHPANLYLKDCESRFCRDYCGCEACRVIKKATADYEKLKAIARSLPIKINDVSKAEEAKKIKKRISRFHDVAKNVRSELKDKFKREICDYHYNQLGAPGMKQTNPILKKLICKHFDARMHWEVLRNVCVKYPDIHLSEEEIYAIITMKYRIDYFVSWDDLHKELLKIMGEATKRILKKRKELKKVGGYDPSKVLEAYRKVEDEFEPHSSTLPEAIVNQPHHQILKWYDIDDSEPEVDESEPEVDESPDSFLDSFNAMFPIENLIKRRHSIQNLIAPEEDTQNSISPKQSIKNMRSRRNTFPGTENITHNIPPELSRRPSLNSLLEFFGVSDEKKKRWHT